MEFYSRIAEAYDELFPYNEKQLLFVEGALGGQLARKSILDMGCGTGALSINMARRSARVRAFDFDEQMIARAEEKRPQALDLQFRKGDIRTISEDYSSLMFDAVICLGNTLVHLDEQEDILKLFWHVSKRLKSGGKFIFQIINYDRILSQQINHLPTIETPNYQFTRLYDHRPDGKIGFQTVLSFKGNPVTENQVVLLPLKKSWVEGPLKELFSSVSFFGGFDRSEWNEDAFHLVIEATL